MPSVTTKSGDKGETHLFGGDRVRKSALRIHAYGTIDELNSILGLILSEEDLETDLPLSLFEATGKAQYTLFHIGADLATPEHNKKVKTRRLTTAQTEEVEEWIEDLESRVPEQTEFLIPSGARLAALFHLARTVCRRAERYIVELSDSEEINDELIVYINRLSDLLYLAARYVNIVNNETELPVPSAQNE